MSGTLLQFATALAGAVSLGDLILMDMELPEKITYGGQQQTTTHKLPGGQRVLDTTGDDPSSVAWSGLFFGFGHAVRRDQLEAMRLAGKPVDLVFKDRAFSVMIADCQYEEFYQRIEYRISCIVIPDPGPDEEDDEADGLGDGETPDTPAKAQEQGQAKVARAKTAAGGLPIPPIPPAAGTP